MRYILSKGKQQELLINTKVALKLSWRRLAEKLGISYTTIREWRDEKWSIKQDVFNKIISLYPKYGYYEKYIIEVREDTWGQKVGGLTTKCLKHGFFDQTYTHKSTSCLLFMNSCIEPGWWQIGHSDLKHLYFMFSQTWS